MPGAAALTCGMSIEQALIAQSRPEILACATQALFLHEWDKGCRPDLWTEPVALEPSFRPICLRSRGADEDGPEQMLLENPPAEGDWLRFRVWISPDQVFDWNRCELFLRQLQGVTHRIAWEIIGNSSDIGMAFACHRIDQPIVLTAFRGEFEHCCLAEIAIHPAAGFPCQAWEQAVFGDYYPPPPYSHLLTRPEELHSSPYESLLVALGQIPAPAIGFLQVLFQPVSLAHDWHRNVQVLLDLEYMTKLVQGTALPVRNAQQAPSGDLKQMASQVETKAHGDKPFYCAALRLSVMGADAKTADLLKSLTPFLSLYQHGGRPFNRQDNGDYASRLSPEAVRRMFLLGLTHRPGFLVNSWELAGLVHLPPIASLLSRSLPIQVQETLVASPGRLTTGTPIGTCTMAGVDRHVCIPLNARNCHTHLIGRSGKGKSSLLEFMILDDLARGDGVAVLDPHGDLVERLLDLLPSSAADRVIYLNPGDLQWVPIWNPLALVPGQDAGRMADDLVGAFKSFVTGWGDRLEHLLRHAIHALLHIPGSTLLDVYNLLRNKSSDSLALRRLIRQWVDNDVAQEFWEQDFANYRKEDIGPPRHKLSKLLLSGPVQLMLSQPDSSFSLRQVMDQGMILLANLSTVGTETRQVLGSLMLSLLHLTALSRSDTPAAQRRAFRIYCDEAHRFVTDSLEDVIVETRKYGVSLTLAHHYLRQFEARQADAISGVETTIIFGVDSRDAEYLTKDLQGLVKVSDLVTLDRGQAIVRCGSDVVRIRTPMPLKIPEKTAREAILASTHQRYCQPTAQVRQAIAARRLGGMPTSAWATTPTAQGSEELVYDEF